MTRGVIREFILGKFDQDWVGAGAAVVPPLSTLELLNVLLMLSVEREWGVEWGVPPWGVPPPAIEAGGDEPPPPPAAFFLKLSGRLIDVKVL